MVGCNKKVDIILRDGPVQAVGKEGGGYFFRGFYGAVD